MTATYDCIATTALGSSASSVSFTSISGSYTDLILAASVGSASAEDLRLRFNSDTGSNYSTTMLYGTGSAAGSARTTSATSITAGFYWGGLPSTLSALIIHIMNYSNSTTYKTVLTRANNTSQEVDAFVGLWRSTSAITSVTLLPNNSASFASGCMFTLYGIKSE